MEQICNQCRRQSDNSLQFSCHHQMCCNCMFKCLITNNMRVFQEKDIIQLKCACQGTLDLSRNALYDILYKSGGDQMCPNHKDQWKFFCSKCTQNSNEFQRQIGQCNSHRNQIKNFYCKKCNEEICRECTQNEGSHCQHDYRRIEDYAMILKDEFKAVPRIDPRVFEELEKKINLDFKQSFNSTLSTINDLIKSLDEMRSDFKKQMTEFLIKEEQILKIIKMLYSKYYMEIARSVYSLDIPSFYFFNAIHLSEPNVHTMEKSKKDINEEISKIKTKVDYLKKAKGAQFEIKFDFNDGLVDLNCEKLSSVLQDPELECLQTVILGNKSEEEIKVDYQEVFSHNYTNDLMILYEILRKMKDYDNCLTVLEKITFPSLIEEAEKYNELGSAYFDSDQNSKAVSCYHTAIALLGEDHKDSAKIFYNLGNVYQGSDDYEKAITFYNKAVQVRLSSMGEKHADTANCYENLGKCYYNLRNYDEALNQHQKALALFIEVFGENHPDTAGCFNSLGIVNYYKNDNDLALSYYEKALKIRQSILGESHHLTGDTYNNIGRIYYIKNEISSAIFYFEKSLKISIANVGESHADTACFYQIVAAAYEANSEEQKAIENYEKSISIYTSLGQPDHRNVGISYRNLAEIYIGQDENETALSYYQKAGRIYELTNGDLSTTMEIYEKTGSLCKKNGENGEAMAAYEKALQAAIEYYGEDNSKVEEIRNIIVSLRT